CFLLGTRLMPYLNRIRRGSKTYAALVWVKRNMRRNAGAAIIIARFIPSERLLLTILLGSVRFQWPMFFVFVILGVLLWSAQALAIGYLGGVLFSGSPLLAMVLSVVLATILGFLVQRTQNKVMNALDVRRGSAEAHKSAVASTVPLVFSKCCPWGTLRCCCLPIQPLRPGGIYPKPSLSSMFSGCNAEGLKVLWSKLKYPAPALLAQG